MLRKLIEIRPPSVLLLVNVLLWKRIPPAYDVHHEAKRIEYSIKLENTE